MPSFKGSLTDMHQIHSNPKVCATTQNAVAFDEISDIYDQVLSAKKKSLLQSAHVKMFTDDELAQIFRHALGDAVDRNSKSDYQTTVAPPPAAAAAA